MDSLKTLEFNKILNKLSAFAVMETSKDEINEIHPETSVKKVRKMQDETAEALTICVKSGSPSFLCRSDIRGSLKRCDMGGVLTPAELLSAARVLSSARGFKKYLKEENVLVLREHIESLYDDKALENKIFSIIIDEETIADDASSELLDIRRKLKSQNNKVRDILEKIVSGSAHRKHLQESIITMRGDRYVIPVKAEHKGDIPGIVHDVSSSGATLFIEPSSVVEANNEIRRLSVLEKEEIEKTLASLSNEISEVSKLMEITYETLILLDIIFAKAKYALSCDAYKPVINDNGIIDLKRARHPLIDSEKVVATDIYLGKDFDTLVVTGPNTGGKTVTLKTIGLLTLMAQSGMHITAKEGSVLSVFENIFADIGDEQSIEQSLSTFSSHIKNIVEITQKADSKTLCLFDELGAGTDPVEGAALATSILEYVKTMGAKTCATTHYSELKMYALSADRVENASCEFNVETLAPIYRLLIGVPGKSNAFEISKRLGLSEFIINKAKEHIDAESVKLEDVLSELERNRIKAEEEREKAEAYKAEAEKLRAAAASKNRALNEKTDKIIEKAKEKAQKVISEAKDEADKLIGDMKRAQKIKDEKEAARLMEKARKTLSDKKKKSAKLAQSTPDFAPGKPPKTVKKGDTVKILSIGQTGTVITLPDSKGNLQVKAGIMKISSNLSDLRLVKEEKLKTKTAKSGGNIAKTMSVGTELDLRGENVEDAIYLIEKFLDDAILSSLSTVRIIHGKGTGVLRSGIHSYLKKQPRVKSFRLGTFGEGDSGVTVVELK